MTVNVAKAAEAGFIKDLTISSNQPGGKNVSLLLGFVELRYFESIMEENLFLWFYNSLNSMCQFKI